MPFFGRTPGQYLAQAHADREASKWRSAARHYQAYLKTKPADGEIWARLAHCLKEDGRLRDAAKAYDRAQALMPLDADLRLQVGHLEKAEGNVQAAIAAYQRALELDPQLQAARDELRHLDAPPTPDRGPAGETDGPSEGSGPSRDSDALVDIARDRAANKREAASDPDRVARSAEAIAGLRRRLPVPPPTQEPHLIPKLLHFIYGFKAEGDIPYYGYMAICSALHFNPGWKVYYYTMHEPVGPNWARIRDQATLVVIDDFDYFGDARLHHYAHKADIVRMIVLTEVGGVYLDLDSLTQKSFEDLRAHDFVMGVQAAGATSSSGLCNAIMMGKRGAAFSTRWLAQYDYFRSRGRDDLWDHHSVKMPVSLAARHPGEITVLDYRAFFYPMWTSIQRALFSDGSARYADYFESAYAFHLWNGATGDWLDKVDDAFVSASPSIYARIAREARGLPAPASEPAPESAPASAAKAAGPSDLEADEAAPAGSADDAAAARDPIPPVAGSEGYYPIPAPASAPSRRNSRA